MEKIQHDISYLPTASSESDYLCSYSRIETFLHLSGDSKLRRVYDLLEVIPSHQIHVL